MTTPENHPIHITGVAELVRSGAFVLSELLRAITEADGPMHHRLLACLEAGEDPVLTVRVLSDQTGVVVELITQEEGALSLTRHAILPILNIKGGSIN